MNAVVDIGFDYSALTPTDRDEVREVAVRIRLRMSRTVQEVIEIGRDLIAVKEKLGHGKFLRWIETEFRMSDHTASNIMNVARRFGDQIPNYFEFGPSVLYALAAPSTSDEVVEEVISKSANGEKVTVDDVKRLKAEAKGLKEKEREARSIATAANNLVSELRKENRLLRETNDILKLEAENPQWTQPLDAAEHEENNVALDEAPATSQTTIETSILDGMSEQDAALYEEAQQAALKLPGWLQDELAAWLDSRRLERIAQQATGL